MGPQIHTIAAGWRAWLVALVLLVAPPASGQITIADGDWNDPGIWDSSAVPGVGAFAEVRHRVRVPDGVDLLPFSVRLTGASALSFDGSSVVGAGLDCSDTAELHVGPASDVVLESVFEPLITLVDAARCRVEGVLRVGATSLGFPDRLIVDSARGTLFEVVGPGTVGSPRTVVDVPMLPDNASGEDLVVELDAAPDPMATHVKVKSGRFAHAIWPVSVDGTRLTIQGALVRPVHTTSTLDGFHCGLDSLGVRDLEAAVDPVVVPGSLVLLAGGECVGAVEKVFPESAPGVTAMFVDREVPSLGASEPFLLSRGIARNTELEFLRLARVEGAPTRPIVDETVDGDATVGNEQRRGIRVAGSIRAEFAEFLWLGSSHAAIRIEQIDGLGDAASFDHTLFREIHASYVMNLAYGPGPGVSRCTVRDCTYFRTLGPVDNAFGHWIRLVASEPGTLLEMERCAAIELKDDLLAVYDGSDLTVLDTWMQDVGAGNFVGATPEGVTARIERCQGWGIGQTPIQVEGGTVDVTLRHNRWAGCGNQIGRNTLDTHETGDSNNLGWLNLNGTGHFLAQSDTVRWSPWRAANVRFAPTDTVRIQGVVFENDGAYTEPGAQAWVPTSNHPGPVELTSDGVSPNVVVVEACEFRNAWRRGPDLSGLGSETHFGVRLRGTGGGLRAWVRGCVFDHAQSYQEGVVAGTRNATVLGRDADWSEGGVFGSRFEGVHAAVNLAGPLRAVPFRHNLLRGRSGAASGPLVSLQSGFEFSFNTVVGEDVGTPTIDVGEPGSLIGNLLLTANAEGTLLSVDDADLLATEVRSNYVAAANATPLQLGSVSMSVLDAEATSAAFTGNAQIVPASADAHLAVVQDLASARLFAASLALDFVPGFVDPDGTVADAGYRYFDQVATAAPPVTPRIARLSVWPNPFNPTGQIAVELDAPVAGVLEVVDLRGRRVAQIARGEFSAGTTRWVWRGVDARGRAVASGTYFVVLRRGPSAPMASRRMVLLR